LQADRTAVCLDLLTFEICIQQTSEERKDMGWHDTFEVMANMSSSHLATKLKAEDTV
jgi:hypothetical protein